MNSILARVGVLGLVAIGLWACEAPPADTTVSNATSSTIPEMPAPAIISPALNVLDMKATEAFYVDMLGMKVMLRLGGEEAEHQEVTLNFSGDLYSSESSLLLNYTSERTEPYVFDGFSRIAFRLKDVEATVEKIRAAGYKILSEPRMIQGTNIKLAFVEDPNDARVELIEGMATKEQLTGTP